MPAWWLCRQRGQGQLDSIRAGDDPVARDRGPPRSAWPVHLHRYPNWFIPPRIARSRWGVLTCQVANLFTRDPDEGKDEAGPSANTALHPYLHGGRCRRVGRRRARQGRRRFARVRRQWVGWQRLRWWEGRRDRHRTSVCGGMEHDECAAPAGVGPDLPAARDHSTGSGPFPTAICSRWRSPRPVRAGWHRICPRLGRRRGRRLACCQRRGPPSCRMLVPGSAGCRAQGRGTDRSSPDLGVVYACADAGCSGCR